MRLFSNRSQMSSKCGKNKKVAYEAQPRMATGVSELTACSAGGFWRGEWIYRMFRPPSWNRKTVESWGEVKSLRSVGGRKKNWGRGKKVSFPRPPPPPTFCHCRSNSPSQQRIQNGGKTLERPPKPPALQASGLFSHLTCLHSIILS